MSAGSRAAVRRAEAPAARTAVPAAGLARRRDAALPAVVAALILAGAALVPLGGGELAPPALPPASAASAASADPVGRPFPPIRSRILLSTGLGMRTLDISVAIAWREHVPEAHSARLVLRRISRSPAAQYHRDARSVTVPVALMTRVGRELSLRAALDVSVLPQGEYAVLLRLPHPTGGAWAPGTREADERTLGTYSAPPPSSPTLCCPAW